MNSARIRSLGAILPLPGQTLLLRASLLRDEDCRSAWNSWVGIVKDAKQAMADDRMSVKRLLPPLYFALRESNAQVEPSLLPYLKLAYVREQMRSRTYLRVLSEVLKTLNDANVPCVLLRGGALATTVYPDVALRHCHDIALLVQRADVEVARQALLATGRTSVLWDARDGGPAAILKDETSLPIELHTNLLNIAWYQLSWDDVWTATKPLTVGGSTTRVLSAEHALIQVCVHASYSKSRDSLRWVGDAWHLLHGAPLNWSDVLNMARQSRTPIPLFVTLQYLHEALGAPVPDSVLETLKTLADDAPAVARDVAIHGARVGECQQLGAFLDRMPQGYAVRALAMYWLLFPSRRYVRESVGARGTLAVAAHYVRRPLMYARRFLAPGSVSVQL